MKKEIWISAGDAAEKLGYADAASINRLASKGRIKGIEVRKKPHPRNKTHFLYNFHDLMEINASLAHKNTNTFVGDMQWAWIEFNNFMKIDPPAIVIADCHCPLVDMKFFIDVLRIRDKEKINKLILAGDTLDCSAQSKFSDLFPIPWKREKKVAKQFIELCCKEFDSVHMLTANHEMRYMRRLGDKTNIDADTMIGDKGKELDVWQVILSNWMQTELQGRLHISIYPYCEVGETWRITHPDKAWKNPSGLARSLQDIHDKSIMMAHAHMSAWCVAPDAKHYLIDVGVFADPVHFSWVNLKEQMRFKWTESFGIIHEDEWATLFMKNHGEIIRK